MRSRLLGAAVAVAVLVPCLAVAAPADAAPRAATRVSISVPRSGDVGHRIRVAGRVTPAKKGKKVAVVIQRRYAGGHWRTVERTRTTKTGRYAARVRLVRAGTTAFRVRAAGRPSRARSLPVYTWLDLVDVPVLVGGSGGVELRRAARIGGRTFPRSIEINGGAGSAGVKTAGLCTTFEAWTGILDVERPGLTAAARANGSFQTGNGAEGAYSTPLGPAVRVTWPLTGRPWVLASVSLANASGRRAVLGSPRVRCNATTLPELTLQDIGG